MSKRNFSIGILTALGVCAVLLHPGSSDFGLTRHSERAREGGTSWSALTPKTAAESRVAVTESKRAQGSLSPSQKSLDELQANSDQVLKLNRKVIKTAAQEEDFKALLSNPELLQFSMETLKAAGEITHSRENEDRRMRAVDVVTQVVKWRANPLRERALHEVRELLKAPMLEKQEDAPLQRSLAGDRVELFVLLQKQDLDSAREVLSSVRGRADERLYRFGSAFYLKQKAGNGS